LAAASNLNLLANRRSDNAESTTCGTGDQGRTAISLRAEEQKPLAESSRRALDQTKTFKKSIVTRIVAVSTLYPGEDYDQPSWARNPCRYKFYRYTWGDKGLKDILGSTD
jgi:peptide-methionine (S)-S-oxide reductase